MYSTDLLDAALFVGLMIYAWIVILPPKSVSPPTIMFMFGHPVGRFISITIMALSAQYGFILTAVALGLYILVCQRDLEK
jgi:hypothetical protein